MLSLSNRLLNLINQKTYCSIDELSRFARELNYKTATGERKLRELSQKGKIKTIYNKGVVIA